MVDPSANHVRVNVFAIIMMRDNYVIMHYVISAFLYIYYYVLCVANSYYYVCVAISISCLFL